uniref:Tc1-like transposase DDE domain-containing protein n=1 Tax=Octopus bimaculoides TaxID=37653 RepID=A0A0L8G6V4_OCTBM
MEHGELMLGWHEDWPELFENIIWSDKAVFHVSGFINRHNCHYWASCNKDLNMMVGRMQAQPKVTMWCRMTATSLQPVYDTMNTDCYLQMLENYVWPSVSGWDNIGDLIFMQDGAPPHFAFTVHA